MVKNITLVVTKENFITGPGSHVIMFSVGRFTCKERVMLIEREIRLLFCANNWCFVTYKHVIRRFLLACVTAVFGGDTKEET